MRFIFSIALLSLTLTGCAYVIDSDSQDITVRTPGATGAYCDMYVKGFRYRVHPPETRHITKSKENLVLDCRAPGNRQRKVVIEPVMARSSNANLITGIVPGLTYDYASGALYKYPEIVTVDFTSVQVRPEDMPAQNADDIRPPESYPLEEFRAGSPRMNSDRYAPDFELQKRARPALEQYESYDMLPPDNLSGDAGGKGELMSVIDSAVNPAGATTPMAEPAPDSSFGSDELAPVQLVPAQ